MKRNENVYMPMCALTDKGVFYVHLFDMPFELVSCMHDGILKSNHNLSGAFAVLLLFLPLDFIFLALAR